MADQAASRRTEAFASFAEAKRSPNGVAVLSGDYDGTIYLTVPMSRVRCTEEQLTTLLSDLDAITWMGGHGYNARVSYHDTPCPAAWWTPATAAVR